MRKDGAGEEIRGGEEEHLPGGKPRAGERIARGGKVKPDQRGTADG